MNKTRPFENVHYLLLIIVLHAIWFTGAVIWRHTHNGDTNDYIFLANNIKNGIYYAADISKPFDPFYQSIRTPLYSVLLLLSYSVFAYSDWPVIILQNIASIASCWTILQLFKQQFPDKKFAWIYLIFLAFYPAQMCFASLLAPDTFLQLLLTLYFRELILSFKTPGTARMAKMSLWLILAALMKPVVYPLLILHCLYSIWCYRNTKKPSVVLLAVLPFLMMMGYGFWNKSRTGLYHISSIQSVNLLNSNALGFLNHKYGQPHCDSVINRANSHVAQQHGLKARYERADKEAKIIIKGHLFDYSIFHLKESIRFFITPGKYDLELFIGLCKDEFSSDVPTFGQEFNKNGIRGAWNFLKNYPSFPLIILIMLFNILRIVGWFLFLYDRQYPLLPKLFSSAYILYFAIITGPVANTRYFMPVLLVMSALSALGFAGFIEKRKVVYFASQNK